MNTPTHASWASVGDEIYHTMFLSKVELVVKKIQE